MRCIAVPEPHALRDPSSPSPTSPSDSLVELDAVGWRDPMKRTEQTACILCSRNCGLERRDRGRRTRAASAATTRIPVSKGYLCQKAARLDHYQDHADRLTHPLRAPARRQLRARRLGRGARRHRRAPRSRSASAHGGRAFAFYGGGGQGNHLGGAYSRQLLRAMRSRFLYSALAQEKTGDFWVNGRLFGDQRCHITEDVEHADFVLFIGTNPCQAHGIPQRARHAARARERPARARWWSSTRAGRRRRELADVHLQLRPGTDAFLLAAMLAHHRARGAPRPRRSSPRAAPASTRSSASSATVPIEEFVRRADVPLADVERVARAFAHARSAPACASTSACSRACTAR